MKSICYIDNCINIVRARGLCANHDRNMRLSGNPLTRPTGWGQNVCTVPNCKAKYLAKGYCKNHYTGFKLYGDPNRRGLFNKIGRSITSNGYVLLIKKGHPNSTKQGRILEHRFVMSEHLNRPLTTYEIVHHINGVRVDNRIENLEIHSKKSHPPGHQVVCPNCEHRFVPLV